jgi:hypothetical protein
MSYKLRTVDTDVFPGQTTKTVTVDRVSYTKGDFVVVTYNGKEYYLSTTLVQGFWES